MNLCCLQSQALFTTTLQQPKHKVLMISNKPQDKKVIEINERAKTFSLPYTSFVDIRTQMSVHICTN
jgi:hypothetical protein